MTNRDASIDTETRHQAPHDDRGARAATNQTPSGLLPKVFRIDRAIVFASTIGLIALSGVLGSMLDWPAWVVAAIGVAFLPYAALMQGIVAGARYRHPLAVATMFADFGWVVASGVAIVLLPDGASAAAPWVLGLQALVIADIGLAKLIGFRR